MLKYLMIFGAIQGFVFSLALLAIKTPKSRITNRLFSILIFVVSLFLLITSQNGYFDGYPKVFLLSLILFYWYCPLYDLVTQSIVSTKPLTFTRQHFLHLVPSVVFILVMLRYLFMPNEEVLQRMATKDYVDLLLVDLFSISMNLTFIWRSWRRMQSHGSHSLLEGTDWLIVFLSFGFAMANVCWLYVALWEIGLPVPVPPYVMETVSVSMSFLIFVFGYLMVIRAGYFSIETAIQSIQYRNFHMNQSAVDMLTQKITAALEATKPYKNTRFSLQDLADLVEVDKFKISYTINTAMNTNFTSLINTYRVEEFIRLVDSETYSNYSILGIATEAGFSSKSTFYKAFKGLKGQSPIDFFDQASKTLTK